ncbi:MAG: cytochrome P450 [Solirubrobacteraceae bacterium]|nr:cytochrome P450 [Solirubrobacteraceae bacterium]
MALVGPSPITQTNPLIRIAGDLVDEVRVNGNYPPGDKLPDLLRTLKFGGNPLPMLLKAYEKYGPVFTIRLLHSNSVFALGPEANHQILVSDAQNFLYRKGHFADLVPLLGDGLLTIDGDFHRSSRRIMLPAFHRERIAGTLDLMNEEIDQAIRRWEPDQELDLYVWTRNLALRIAMRALFGLDPDKAREDLDAAHEFENALGFWGQDPVQQMRRGPFTPWSKMTSARDKLDKLIFGEIARRRKTGERGEDLMSMLLDAKDEDGTQLSDKHVRDQTMTLLFAGHDTTTATICFMNYELARAPQERELLREERRAFGHDAPDFAAYMGGALPHLDMALEETLRLWPAAWIGPRRTVDPIVLAGMPVPGNAYVNYSSWASHRLPDVWDAPDEFMPDRFSPENRKQIPKGAYIPFGAGSRICIGMRFGQLEIRAIMARILRDFDVELKPGWKLRTSQTPTIGPRNGMPVIVRAA